MPNLQQEYLGDSVYAANDGFHIILSISNGIDYENVIYLDPSVLEALKRYADRLWAPGPSNLLKEDPIKPLP